MTPMVSHVCDTGIWELLDSMRGLSKYVITGSYRALCGTTYAIKYVRASLSI